MPDWAKSLFVAASWGATGLDVLAALGVLAWRLRRARRPAAPHAEPPHAAMQRGSPRVTVDALLAALLAGLLLCAAKVLGLVVLGTQFGGFGPIRLLFLSAALVPLAVAAGAGIARASGRRLTRPALALAGMLLFPPLLAAHVAFVAPYQWVVERTSVPMPRMPAGAAPIRVVVLADLQTDSVGAPEQRAFDLALAEQADIVLLPGDFFQGPDALFARESDRWRDWMARLDPPFGAYACLGNIDPVERAPRLFAGTHVRLLQNEVIEINVRGTRVALCGVEWQFDRPQARAARRTLAASSADIRLTLAHTPDAALVDGDDLQADLIISGHTHGGQVVIPGLGPPLTFVRVSRAVAAGGLHEVNGHRVYVSRGVGFERGVAPPMRFFCPPEISVLTLTPPD